MNYNRFIEPSPLAEQQRLAGLEVTEGKQPAKRQQEALVKAYAMVLAVRRSGASVAVQQRKYEAYEKKRAELEAKYPNIDFYSSTYQDNLTRAAEIWIKKHPIAGAGLPGLSY